MIFNGELVLWQPATSPFVYQDIHTLDYRCRYTAQHIEFLNVAADKLFGIRFRQTTNAIGHQANELLKKNRITRNSTVGVRLSLDTEGNYRLEYSEPTIYAGYTLRSLHPTTLCISGNISGNWKGSGINTAVCRNQHRDAIIRIWNSITMI